MCRQKEKEGLGFRDIERFNQALLGKQAWRIFDKPSSLLAQILQHRYFRNQSFLNSGVGNRPLYGWRSIMWGRDLLKKGLLVKVGNGQSTRVWKDNWIDDEFLRSATQFYEGIDENLRVADLWYPNSTTWNLPILRHYFNERDVTFISRIRPNPTREDESRWNFSRHGEYTTQTAYKLSESILEASEYQNTNIPAIETRLEYGPPPPPRKIRHFFWRVARGAMAVAERLNTRGMNVDTLCPSCHSGPETVCHVLFLCPMATHVWSEVNLPPPRSGFSHNSIFINLHHLLACCDSAKIPIVTRRAFLWVLWHIWKARNSFTLKKTRISIESLVEQAYEEADEWFMANGSPIQIQVAETSTTPCTRKWEPPPPSFTKCSIGSDWCLRSGGAGVVWLLRNHLGNPLFHSRRSFSNARSTLEAELLSVLWATENMGNMSQSKVIFELSSEQAIQAVISPSRYPEHGSLLSEIMRYLNKLEEWRIVYLLETSIVLVWRIACSVIAEQRHQSYIARGAPSWLRALIISEKSYSTTMEEIEIMLFSYFFTLF
ncbi:putative mitochondrial protein [Cardamine amara subsp. amara]|uniref:Mitochondrial protein n=1 Tax=Cardamine amara subsp. amara TaxID=228776 RepID=A0ABD1C983_CARAN